MRRRTALFIWLLAVVTACEAATPSDLEKLIAANERFGRRLLKATHATAPERNVVVAPLGLSVIFSVIGRQLASSHDEIGYTLEWLGLDSLEPSRTVLLSRFQRPAELQQKADHQQQKLYAIKSPEELWVENSFSYLGKGNVSDWFLADARSAGITIDAAADRSGLKQLDSKLPALPSTSDFWFASLTHLRTEWAGNIFTRSYIKSGFQISPTKWVDVDVMSSETYIYDYANTATFEAIRLPCWQANLFIVMPAEGKSLGSLEEDLAHNPKELDSVLSSSLGDVQMPKIHIKFEADMQPVLTSMGIERAFGDLAEMIRIPGSKFTGIPEKVDLIVDGSGIRADAGIVMHGVYGGILGGSHQPFHMKVNRPFVFLIRDRVTDTLIFAGAVTDPSQD